MQLDEQPPTGSVFMGWTNEEVAFTDGYGLFRIGHPQGAPQAYSEQDVDTSKGTCRTATGSTLTTKWAPPRAAAPARPC